MKLAKTKSSEPNLKAFPILIIDSQLHVESFFCELIQV